MAKQYKRLGIDLLATGGTDVRVKVSLADTTSGFLDEKAVPAASGKITTTIANAGFNETLEFDVDETNIDHNILLNYDVNEHRPLDDAQTTTSNLWSADKIQTELDEKVNRVTPVSDNSLIKSVGSTGVDFEETGINVDDSNNVTGINDLTVSGDLTVNGTTTSINSTDLEVVDSNITVNKGGTQAAATTNVSGFTVEMSDATDARIGYDQTLTSKFKAGEIGSEKEITTVSDVQSLTNKTIDANNNTISNLEHGNEVDDPSSDVHGVGVGNDVVGTGTTQTLTNKTIDLDNNTLSNIETDNFKTGVIDTDLSTVSATDDTIPSAKAVKDYVDSKMSAGDLLEANFSGSEGVAVFSDVTGLAFANGTVRSFEALVSVSIDATADLFEQVTLRGIQIAGDWQMSIDSVGDNTQVSFDITSLGQVQYISSTYAGFVSLDIDFRAITTSI